VWVGRFAGLPRNSAPATSPRLRSGIDFANPSPATALLQLWERGIGGTSTPILEILPAFPREWPITYRANSRPPGGIPITPDGKRVHPRIHRPSPSPPWDESMQGLCQRTPHRYARNEIHLFDLRRNAPRCVLEGAASQNTLTSCAKMSSARRHGANSSHDFSAVSSHRETCVSKARSGASALQLSDSSYRFQRRLIPSAVTWRFFEAAC